MWYHFSVSKREKRLQKIRNNPKHVSFKDLDLVLRDFGFTVSQRSRGSSHYVYMLNEIVLTVPKKQPFLKVVYVKKALLIIEGLNDE